MPKPNNSKLADQPKETTAETHDSAKHIKAIADDPVIIRLKTRPSQKGRRAPTRANRHNPNQTQADPAEVTESAAEAALSVSSELAETAATSPAEDQPKETVNAAAAAPVTDKTSDEGAEKEADHAAPEPSKPRKRPANLTAIAAALVAFGAIVIHAGIKNGSILRNIKSFPENHPYIYEAAKLAIGLLLAAAIATALVYSGGLAALAVLPAAPLLSGPAAYLLSLSLPAATAIVTAGIAALSTVTYGIAAGIKKAYTSLTRQSKSPSVHDSAEIDTSTSGNVMGQTGGISAYSVQPESREHLTKSKHKRRNKTVVTDETPAVNATATSTATGQRPGQ